MNSVIIKKNKKIKRSEHRCGPTRLESSGDLTLMASCTHRRRGSCSWQWFYYCLSCWPINSEVSAGSRSFSQCKCGGNRLRRRRRCTWGTSSGVCHSESWRTRSRRRGSTLSVPRPSHESCSTDMLNVPGVGGEEREREKREWFEQ